MTADEFDVLFRRCVAETGPAYADARNRLLAEGRGILPWLDELLHADDHRVATTARILRERMLWPSLFDGVGRVLAERPDDDSAPGFGFPPGFVARELASAGEPAVPALLELATKTYEYASGGGPQIVLQAIALLGDRRAVPPLLDLLRVIGEDGRAGDEQVRPLVLSALGDLAGPGDRGVFDAVREVLGDERRTVVERATAALTLGRLGDPAAVELLVRLARAGEAEPMIRLSAIQAVGELWQSSGLTADPVPEDPVPGETDLAELLRDEADERAALELARALARLDAPGSAGRLGVPGGPGAEALAHAAATHPSLEVRHTARTALDRAALPRSGGE